MPEPESFGDRLRMARRRARWTRDRLAHEAGIASGTIARLEQGRGRHVEAETVGKLARALQVSTDFLLGLSTTICEQRPC